MTHLYSQVPSMARLLTLEEQTHFEGRTLNSVITSPTDLKTVFSDRKGETASSQVYYNKVGAKINSEDPDALIPRRTSAIPRTHTQFKFSSSGSASQAIPYYKQTREPWGQTSDNGYNTALTSMTNPRQQDEGQLGFLEGILSAYQRFPGSTQNWQAP